MPMLEAVELSIVFELLTPKYLEIKETKISLPPPQTAQHRFVVLPLKKNPVNVRLHQKRLYVANSLHPHSGVTKQSNGVTSNE